MFLLAAVLFTLQIRGLVSNNSQYSRWKKFPIIFLKGLNGTSWSLPSSNGGNQTYWRKNTVYLLLLGMTPREKRLEHETNKFQLLISWITHRHRLQTILYIHVTSMLISCMLTFHVNCKNSWDCQRNAYKNALLDSRAYCYYNIYDFFFYNSSFMYICFVKYNASEVLVFLKKKKIHFL